MLQRHGLTSADVCTFGDAENDLGMLDWARYSVCPSNGRPPAKERAAFVSRLSNDEDFIADALERPASSCRKQSKWRSIFDEYVLPAAAFASAFAAVRLCG